MTRLIATLLAVVATGLPMLHAQTITHTLPGSPASSDAGWRPRLALREQTLGHADRRRPVLYVHGATFPSASSIMFRFEGRSWADALNEAGFSAWGLDFAGYGDSERYPEMTGDAPAPGAPLGRAPVAADQIERAARFILAETGASRLSVIAHSWGTIATGLFLTRHPELVERAVFFGPIARRHTLSDVPSIGPWRLITLEEQYRRFVEDVPPGHPGVLAEADLPSWNATYLASDEDGLTRSPPAVKTPTGPAADIMAAWSGKLGYNPAAVTVPIAIVRGEWDSLCTDADAASLRASLGSGPDSIDVKIPQGTHLMHLEQARAALYGAANAFLGRK
ncbi:alpha/beta hydrolase [Bradyrhizobium sp. WD16]|uniref:alpha/beta hydrolase n=1 Tax=Bradyrhizobium sp. WD16 TaxID=1521768 RepID=UPI0020A39769|nr:alpha/beta fold hydrolase [Bradyrhizobium sp. WD16]